MKKILFILSLVIFNSCSSNDNELKLLSDNLIELKNASFNENQETIDQLSSSFNSKYTNLSNANLTQIQKNELDSLHGIYIALISKNETNKLFNTVKQNIKGFVNEMVK